MERELYREARGDSHRKDTYTKKHGEGINTERKNTEKRQHGEGRRYCQQAELMTKLIMRICRVRSIVGLIDFLSNKETE